MDALSVFHGSFDQANRVIEWRCGASGVGNVLITARVLPQRIVYTEALSQPYSLRLFGVSDQPEIQLAPLLGMPVSVRIHAEQTTRVLTGLVHEVDYLGTEGGFAGVSIRIGPALSLLDKRHATRMFQDQSIPDIVAQVLQEHIQHNRAIGACFRLQSMLHQSYAPRSYLVQHQESDLALIQRILAAEGISYRFAFDDSGDAPVHTLILFDDNSSLPASDIPVLDYLAQSDASAGTLTRWRAERRIVNARTSLLSHDYKPAAVMRADDLTAVDQGEQESAAASTLEDYRALSPYAAKGSQDLQRYACLRQQAHDLRACTFRGEASVPLLAGTVVRVDHHPLHAQDPDEQREFVITGQQLTAVNNLPADLLRYLSPGLLDLDETTRGATLYDPRIATCFQAVRNAVPIVPAPVDTVPLRGAITATVVGPVDAEVHTDELGRILIQPHSQRLEEHPHGGANFDVASSTWVRCAHPWASDGFGLLALPRVGDEVVVGFLDNDPDRPLVIASVHNGRRAVARFGNVSRLPGDNALSGWRSREHHGDGYSQVLMDDTTGQLRTSVATSAHASELQLGHLATPRSNGKATPRGVGAELRTDAYAALRSLQGLLLSTCAPVGAANHQLEREALAQWLEQGAELLRALSDYAKQHGGQVCDTQGQQALVEALRSWPTGTDTHAAGKPLMALAAAEGLITATPKSFFTYAGCNADIVAQQHVQLTAGQQVGIQAGQDIHVFTQAGAINLVANQGEFAAHAVQVTVQAQQVLQLEATEGQLSLRAKNIELTTQGGGSYLHMTDEYVEIGSKGPLRVRTATHDFEGPASVAGTTQAMNAGDTDQRFRLHFPRHGDADPSPAPGQRYRITLDDGRVIEGQSDATGLTDLAEADRMRIAHIELFEHGL